MGNSFFDTIFSQYSSNSVFLYFSFGSILLGLSALYCMLVSRNLIRIIIGMELLTKAVTLLIAVCGYVTNRMALAQSMIITLIVIEVVVIAVAAGIVVGSYQHTGGVSSKDLRDLHG